MALPVPNLDDRKFQDFVDEAKRAIPGLCPEWTNHNVSDPGVALIELFAWMSESVLYRLNQVPERLYVHFLNLVGTPPFGPSVARTDLTFMLSAPLKDHEKVQVSVHTEVTTAEAVVFTTLSPLVMAPRVHQAMLTATGTDRVIYQDVSKTLKEAGGVTCFAHSRPRVGDALYLGYAASLAGLVLRLEVKAGNEGAKGIGINPKDPPLLWEVWSGKEWVAAVVQDDATGGLNKNGSILLRIPLAHESQTLGGLTCHWLRVRLIDKGKPYTASPRIEGLVTTVVGGTVAAEHATVVGQELLGSSNGQPGQRFVPSRVPVLPRTEDEKTIRVITTTYCQEWREQTDFTSSGDTDRHFVWDNASGTVTFGPLIRYANGDTRQHGAVPAEAAEIFVTGYRYGGGLLGNVAAHSLTVLRSTEPYIESVTNFAAAVGGVDGESVAEAMQRGPLTLRTGQRAVTPRDFERITRDASVEVARALCPRSVVAGAPIRVLVVPHVRSTPDSHRIDDFVLGSALVTTIRTELDRRRLVGTRVDISTPSYLGVSVAVRVQALPDVELAGVQHRVTDALSRFINPLTGGPDGKGWPFDTDLNSAAVEHLLETVEGVHRVEEVQLFEYDLTEKARLGVGLNVVRCRPESLFLSALHQVVVSAQ
jgi:predicted phage baseplate assembly protein